MRVRTIRMCLQRRSHILNSLYILNLPRILDKLVEDNKCEHNYLRLIYIITGSGHTRPFSLRPRRVWNLLPAWTACSCWECFLLWTDLVSLFCHWLTRFCWEHNTGSNKIRDSKKKSNVWFKYRSRNRKPGNHFSGSKNRKQVQAPAAECWT